MQLLLPFTYPSFLPSLPPFFCPAPSLRVAYAVSQSGDGRMDAASDPDVLARPHLADGLELGRYGRTKRGAIGGE